MLLKNNENTLSIKRQGTESLKIYFSVEISQINIKKARVNSLIKWRKEAMCFLVALTHNSSSQLFLLEITSKLRLTSLL